MNVLEFVQNNKKVIGIIFLLYIIVIIFFLLRINSTPPEWTNCKQNQTFATCDGKQICIDNCKENEIRCGDICDKNCCDDNSSCIDSTCCPEKNVCLDQYGIPSNCCKDTEFCVNYKCVPCEKGKEKCSTKDPKVFSCCDSSTEECCGDSGCCKKEYCITDTSGNKFCCDEENSLIIDGKCCRLESVYEKDGKLVCCETNNVCYDGNKASCCDGGSSVCYDTGYCINSDSAPSSLKGQCIVSGGGKDISTGKFCVNKLEDAIEKSSFTQCTDGGKECPTNEICKDLSYRKPPGGCTDSSQCSGLGQQNISQKCYDVIYEPTSKKISYTENRCDPAKQQIKGGNCSLKCDTNIYCPEGDTCTVFKPPPDGKGVISGPYCSSGKQFQGGINYSPSPIILQGDSSEALNTCAQYYEVTTNNYKSQISHTPNTVKKGDIYVIKKSGNFKSVGSSDNNVGTIFKAKSNNKYTDGIATPVKCTMYNTKSNSAWNIPEKGKDWTPANIDLNPIKDPLNGKYYCPLSHTETDGNKTNFYTAVPILASANMSHAPVHIAGQYSGYGAGTELPKMKSGYPGPYTVDQSDNHFTFGPGDKSNLRTMSSAHQQFTSDVKKGDVNPSDCYNHFNNAGVQYVELDESQDGPPICRAQYNCDNPEYINSIGDVYKKIPNKQLGQLCEVQQPDGSWKWGGLACYDGESPQYAEIRDEKDENLLSYYWYCNNQPTFLK